MKKNIARFNSHCCGCGACVAVCPRHAIAMEKNYQGFYYPTVNERKCVNCGKCLQQCAFNAENREEPGTFIQETYAVKHYIDAVRAASRSGGIFTALSDVILDAGGVVYGCALENNREAVHIRATTKLQRDQLRGSKYIQSKTMDIWDNLKADLDAGLWVLFSGTSCQVDAVRSFCRGANCEKLLLVDIVCHGVPSPMVWGDYLDYLSAKQGAQILRVDFRDKKRFGWSDHKETVVFDDGSVCSGETFKRLFYDHYILRRDCFDCPYRNLKRVSDITIGDCWGIADHYKNFYDEQGVSLVLINSKKGREFFSKLQGIETIWVDISKLLQPPLHMNWPQPENYDVFWRFYSRHSFRKVIERFVEKKKGILLRAVLKLKRLLGRLRRCFSK